MFGIGANELVIILIFAFIIFGPDKLPEIAKTVGTGIRKFRSAQEEMNRVIKTEVYDPNAEDPFKNPLDALAKLENDAKREDKAESFSERKARYDKQRAARKEAEARRAEQEKAKAAEESKAASEQASAAVAATEERPAAAEKPAAGQAGQSASPAASAASAKTSRPDTALDGTPNREVPESVRKLSVEELYGTRARPASAKGADAARPAEEKPATKPTSRRASSEGKGE